MVFATILQKLLCIHTARCSIGVWQKLCHVAWQRAKPEKRKKMANIMANTTGSNRRTRTRRTDAAKTAEAQVETPEVETPAETPEAETTQVEGTEAQTETPEAPETPEDAPKDAPKDEPAKPLAGGKLRWVFPNGKNEYPDGKTQFAELNGNKYAITGKTGEWTATHVGPDGTQTVLAEPGSFGRAYTACVKHHGTHRITAAPVPAPVGS